MPRAHVPLPRIHFAPPSYVCARTHTPLTIDGNLEKPEWAAAPWSSEYVDIEGSHNRPLPAQRTRMKMLWDEEYLYVGAELMEHRIWATLTERDCVIYYDNDFELFFDPTGSTHAYFEIELNALGTVWDLLMTKPYRDEGIPVYGFDVKGMKVGIHVDGVLNGPGPATDADAVSKRWCVEVAIPWASLYTDADRTHHAVRAPKPGTMWRMNFSRVEWRTEVVDGQIRKQLDPATGKPYPEDNWVWAPTGLIDIHYPELWGCVIFQDEATQRAEVPETERVKWALRLLYYRQHAHRDAHGCFTADFSLLRGEEEWPVIPQIEITRDLFQATLASDHGTWSIREDGYVWCIG